MKIKTISEFYEAKEFGGNEKDFKNWTDGKVKQYWNTLKDKHETWTDKVNSLKGKIDNPEAFLATLQKRATGKWPNEK